MLPRENLFTHLVETGKKFITVRPAAWPAVGRFLSPSLNIEAKLMSLFASSTLNAINLHGNINERICELHQDKISNRLSLI